MGELVPFSNERVKFVFEIGEVSEVRRRESLSLQNREPLLDLIHPGTVDGREMKTEAGMECEPRHDLFASVHAEVVAHDVDERDERWSLTLDLGQQFDEVLLALALSADSDDASATSIESAEQLKSAVSSVLMFESHGTVGTCGPGGALSGAWLQRGLLVD